jgi:hypothetical protein
MLNASRIPEALRHLLPLAERFGVSDDLDREDLVSKASCEEIALLKQAIAVHDKELDDWLAGPEADRPPYSAEYIAYSAMRMASDFA